MATGEKRTNFDDKRNLPQQRLKDTFFDYLLDRLNEVTSRIWGGKRGVFGVASLVAAGNDKFSVTTLPVQLLDGAGNVLTLSGTDGTNVEFENALGIPYYAGGKHCLIPSGVLRNSRNTVIFYDTEEDRIGEVEEPDTVLEVTGTLRFEVDSVFETGVDHSGRLCSVWLRRPVSIQEAVAVERNLLVQWIGGKNVIYTTGLLGQAGGSALTDAAEYQVCAQGITVRRNTDLRTHPDYAFLGIVTGGGAGAPPGSFDIGDQINVAEGINPDLQSAYGVGRTITTAAGQGGAVRIRSADSGDLFHSVLHLDRRGASEDVAVGLVNLGCSETGISHLDLWEHHDGGTDLQRQEAITSNATAGRIDFSRGGVDLVGAGVLTVADLVVCTGFSTAEMNQIYKITGVFTGYLTLATLAGGSTSGFWSVGESGLAEVVRPRFMIKDFSAAEEFCGDGVIIQGSMAENLNNALLNLYPRNSKAPNLHCHSEDGPLQTEISEKGIVTPMPSSWSGGPLGNEAMHFDRFGDTSLMQVNVGGIMGGNGSIASLFLQPYGNVPECQDEEDVTIGSGNNLITFTRSGVDLTHVNLKIKADTHLVLLKDGVDAKEPFRKLYTIASFTATTMNLKNEDNSLPSFTGGSMKAVVLIPRYVMGSNSNLWYGGTHKAGSILLNLMDGYAGGAVPVNVMTENPYSIIRIWDASKQGSPVYPPRELLQIDPGAVGNAHEWPFRFRRGMIVKGGDVTGSPGEESFYWRDGVRIYDAGGGIGDRDPMFPLVVDALFPEEIPTLHSKPVAAWDTLGGHYRAHHFRDDFFYHPSKWLDNSTGPIHYTIVTTGANSKAIAADSGWGGLFATGAAFLETGIAGGTVELAGNNGIVINSDKDFRWQMAFRIGIPTGITLANLDVRVGFFGAGNHQYYLWHDPSIQRWKGMYWDGASVVASTATLLRSYNDQMLWGYIGMSGSQSIYFAGHYKNRDTVYYSAFETSGSRAGSSEILHPKVAIEVAGASSEGIALDYWEWWDQEILYGRLGNSYNMEHI